MKSRLISSMRHLSFILTVALCSLSEFAFAGNLRAILVGDTTDASLGMAMQANILDLEKELNDISSATGLTLKLQEINGKNAKVAQVKKAINELVVQKDDVVLLYFSCHGYRNENQQSPWPNAYMTLDGAGIDIEKAAKTLLAKKPRLLIVLADCCNSYVGGDIIAYQNLQAGPEAILTAKMVKNYQKLFNETSGFIIASGCKPGEFSWGVNGVGSFLTMGFLESLRANVSGNQSSWDFLFTDTVKRVDGFQDSWGIYDERQNPQYEVAIKPAKP